MGPNPRDRAERGALRSQQTALEGGASKTTLGQRYREVYRGDDPTARAAAHKATTRLIENADHLLCSTPQEKHAMLHLLETIRTVKNVDHEAHFDTLKKDSERVIEDTIMASFKSAGAYRRFVEDLFPMPAAEGAPGDLPGVPGV